MKIGKKLKGLRASRKITQQKLADMLGVKRGSVGQWEVDKSPPSRDNLIKLTEIFDVDMDYFLGEKKLPANSRGSCVEVDYLPKSNNVVMVDSRDYQKGMYAIKMVDDSMDPEIRKGDTLLCVPIKDEEHIISSGAYKPNKLYYHIKMGDNPALVRGLDVFGEYISIYPLNRARYKAELFMPEDNVSMEVAKVVGIMRFM